MGRPFLTSAFCCCTLKVGGIVMGVISIGLSLIMLVGITLYTIENGGKNYNEENSTGKVQPFTVEDKFALAAQVFHVSTIFWLSISTIICSVFLIWGTMTKRTRMMFPWLISFALLIVYVFYNFWNIQVEYFTTFKNILGGLLIYSVELLVLAFLIYCWMCVYSLYTGLVYAKHANYI